MRVCVCVCVRVRARPRAWVSIVSVFPLIKILKLTDFYETWYAYKPLEKNSKPYRTA